MRIFALLFLLAFPIASHAESFREVRDRIYAEPLSTLPSNEGLGAMDFARAIFRMTGELIARARWTLAVPSDFKPRAPKILHPMGVCAEARWTIDGLSSATGMFAQGASVPAIVRFSTADTKTVYEVMGSKRVFGFAVKLFPGSDETARVETANIFTLDQTGLDGDERAMWLGPGPHESPVYFENKAEGSGFAASLLTSAFGKLDKSPTVRPLYPVSEVNADGTAVASPMTPRLVRFVPHGERRFAWDFRDEILAHVAGAIRFDIILPEEGVTIGSLKIGKPVASTVCDQELHFRHHPAR